MARHFLGRLREALYATRQNVLSNGMHCNWQLVDLELWKGFLDLANGGISLN
jgi:hypothetical protein